MKAVIASRSFALADLGCAFLSGAILYSRPWGQVGVGGQFNSFPWLSTTWPLLIALFPCLIRLASGQFPVRRTVFDLFLIVFILSAGLGLWAAYDLYAAWIKLSLLLGAIFIYYALAGQPEENLWLAAGLMSLVGVLTSLGFLFGHDFRASSADLQILNRLGQVWNAARQVSSPDSLSPNFTGGILASLIAFPLAIAIYAWREQRWLVLVGALVAIGMMGFGLVLTSSRGAWIALLVGLGLLALWELSRYPANILGQPQEKVFALTFLIFALPLFVIIAAWPGNLLQLANFLPGFPSGSSRLELARDSLYLIADFPFTGGGLNAFPGLYSQYIQVIPFFFFGYSHNMYLDIALEQGVFAILALVGILGMSLYLLFLSFHRHTERHSFSLLRNAVMVGLVVVCIHGLIDDAFYAGKGVIFMFSLPAFVIAYINTEKAPVLIPSSFRRNTYLRIRRILLESIPPQQTGLLATGLIILMLLALLMGGGKALLARYYANLGAVLQARAELAGFPTGKWDPDHTREVIGSQPVQKAQAFYNRSIQLEPDNVTARYRLGLIAFGRDDFPAAILQLQRAEQAAPDHHGIRKILGYAYTWTGQLEPAMDLLIKVPEAKNEMEVYSWWWQDQGHPDRARFAKEMALQLSEAGHKP